MGGRILMRVADPAFFPTVFVALFLFDFFMISGQGLGGVLFTFYRQIASLVYVNINNFITFPEGMLEGLVYSAGDVADVDRDGRPDFFIFGQNATVFPKKALYIQNANHQFVNQL